MLATTDNTLLLLHAHRGNLPWDVNLADVVLSPASTTSPSRAFHYFADCPELRTRLARDTESSLRPRRAPDSPVIEAIDPARFLRTAELQRPRGRRELHDYVCSTCRENPRLPAASASPTGPDESDTARLLHWASWALTVWDSARTSSTPTPALIGAAMALLLDKPGVSLDRTVGAGTDPEARCLSDLSGRLTDLVDGHHSTRTRVRLSMRWRRAMYGQPRPTTEIYMSDSARDQFAASLLSWLSPLNSLVRNDASPLVGPSARSLQTPRGRREDPWLTVALQGPLLTSRDQLDGRVTAAVLTSLGDLAAAARADFPALPAQQTSAGLGQTSPPAPLAASTTSSSRASSLGSSALDWMAVHTPSSVSSPPRRSAVGSWQPHTLRGTSPVVIAPMRTSTYIQLRHASTLPRFTINALAPGLLPVPASTYAQALRMRGNLNRLTDIDMLTEVLSLALALDASSM